MSLVLLMTVKRMTAKHNDCAKRKMTVKISPTCSYNVYADNLLLLFIRHKFAM